MFQTVQLGCHTSDEVVQELEEPSSDKDSAELVQMDLPRIWVKDASGVSF